MQTQDVIRGEIISALIELGRPATAAELVASCSYRNRIDGTSTEIWSVVQAEVDRLLYDGILSIVGHALIGSETRVSYYDVTDVLTAMTLAVDAA